MHDLRQEMIDLVQSANGNVDKCEQRLMDQIKMLNDRCDNLQTQIKDMKEEKGRDWDQHLEKAKETLLKSQDFNIDGHTSKQTNIADLAEDGKLPQLGKFESSRAKYLANLKTERFK